MNRESSRELVTREISVNDIAGVMERCPTLGTFGFGTYGQYHPDFPRENAEELIRDREALLGSLNQFRIACKWLSKVEKSSSINHSRSSYGLKHEVERCYGAFYCSNGTFIAAAIFMGFDWVQEGPYACFNFEQTSLDRMTASANATVA